MRDIPKLFTPNKTRVVDLSNKSITKAVRLRLYIVRLADLRDTHTYTYTLCSVHTRTLYFDVDALAYQNNALKDRRAYQHC